MDLMQLALRVRHGSASVDIDSHKSDAIKFDKDLVGDEKDIEIAASDEKPLPGRRDAKKEAKPGPVPCGFRKRTAPDAQIAKSSPFLSGDMHRERKFDTPFERDFAPRFPAQRRSSSPRAPSISRNNQPTTIRSDRIKEEHLMSNLELSDDSVAVGNYTNEFGDRSDAENRGILFTDQIPGLHQSNQLADGDGAKTSPPRTSIDGVPSSILNVSSKKPRKRKFGTSDCGKQEKMKIDNKVKSDEFGCKRMKNENTSMEAENELMMDKCARLIKDLNRRRQTVEFLKDKCNQETAEIAELSMILINNGNENWIQFRERLEQLVSSRAQLRAGIADQLKE
ncbi:PREDICTED: uncharacterized protein LOC105124423 [Populus euphratica]|uniref:Uncharacterized protein LOC105124423 n=1 Tax=Populus euphratica TaxID=75702 RepID=A0AAJ6U4X7_POPEU|nr:PREDICTED: uncharacterized protein LOC105124423 [Populus euphratica]